MEDSISGSLYGDKLNEEELKLAHQCALSFLKLTKSRKYNHAFSYFESTCERIVRKKINAKKDLSFEERQELIRKIVDVLMDENLESNVLYHCWCGLGENKACFSYDRQIKGMNRPFYQGYTGQSWYSFDKTRWSDKISSYQYRDPGEEFAETYASYHAAPAVRRKKGEITPKPLLQWFLKEGLDKADPARIKGQAGAKKDEDHN